MTRARTEALAAAAAAHLCGATAALARIGGDAGVEARAAAAGWAAAARPARARALMDAVALVRGAVPRNLALVHREWIEAALAGEGGRVRAIVAGTTSAAPEVCAYVERRVLGRFVSMPRAIAWPAPAPLAPEVLAAAPPAWLEATLARAGRYQLAHAAVGAPRAEIAGLAVRLGGDGPAFVDALGEVAAAGDGAALRWGPRRAAIARAAGVASRADDPDAVIAIGARAFAPHLAGDEPRQLAQRLPRGLGLRVLAELARAPAVEAPPWAELVAAPAR